MISLCVPYVLPMPPKGSPHKFHMSLCVAYVFLMLPPGVPSDFLMFFLVLILRPPAVTLGFPPVFFMFILRPPRGPSMIISLCSLCFSDGPPRGDLAIHYVLLMFLLCAPLAVAYDFLVSSSC